jgi:hypothetical protein
MNTIQSLVESANPWKSLQGDAAKLANKWSKTGLLEGLGEDVHKNNMALMLENQAKQLVIESSQVNGGTATFNVGSGENWAGIALPLVRKVFGQIAAKEFVSVQPMNLPSGLVFFLDFQYGTGKNPFTANSSLYGGTSTSASQFPYSTNDTTGGLYGAGRFTYTTNQFSASLIVSGAAGGGTTPTLTAGTGSVVTASWAELNFDSAYSASVAGNGIYKVTVTTASILTNFDQDAVRGFVLSGSGFASSALLPQFTNFNYTANTIAFFFTGSTSAFSGNPAGAVTVFYNKSTADNRRGDFEDTPAGTTSVPNSLGATSISSSIPEINIQMQSQAITAKTKKLKAAWTPEFAQDLNAYQNLDAEAELTNIMSEYISLEIDLEILDMLITDVPSLNTEYWSAINNTVITGSAPSTLASGFYNTQGTWFQTLGTKINKISNRIHQLTLRGGANFMVVSPTISTILESIPGFAANASGTEDMEYAFGVQKAGQFNSRYTVYKNPYMTENTILVGFRGKQFLEAGAVFAPYIPLIMTPLIYDPNTFTPRKGLLTRYAKKMLRPEFYGKVLVNGLNTL